MLELHGNGKSRRLNRLASRRGVEEQRRAFLHWLERQVYHEATPGGK